MTHNDAIEYYLTRARLAAKQGLPEKAALCLQAAIREVPQDKVLHLITDFELKDR